ncbi:MAG: DUF456 domain-containing protein [Desulfonauticus sp.]|nr:DUF456 domain-containing protein [Desulfonauticus sp.]
MFFVYVFILFLFLLWSLNFLSLPGNWLIIAALAVFDYFNTQFHFGLWWWVGFIALAGTGEAVEWIGQYWGGKKYGLSKSGNWAAIVGAFLGSFVGMPFFLGFGALVGALVGAYIASFGVEYLKEPNLLTAHNKAKGAFLGKALGLIAKLGFGMAILAISIPKLLG